MEQSYYNYENEAIGALVIGQVVSELTEISIAKSLIILPLLLHDPIIKRINGNARYRSLDHFIIKERTTIGDFNARFQDLLPITINAISILNETEILFLDGMYLKTLKKPILEQKMDIGKRAEKILKAIPKCRFLFTSKDSTTYLKFNLEI